MDCFKLDGLDKAYQILDKPVVPPFVAKKKYKHSNYTKSTKIQQGRERVDWM